MYIRRKAAKSLVITTKVSNMEMIPKMGSENIKRLMRKKNLDELKKMVVGNVVEMPTLEFHQGIWLEAQCDIYQVHDGKNNGGVVGVSTNSWSHPYSNAIIEEREYQLLHLAGTNAGPKKY